METTVYLMNCYMLDINHNHTVNFKSKLNQINWFMNKVTYIMNECRYIKKEESLVIDKYVNSSEIRKTNYCMIRNDEGKEEFYFVTNKQYLNDETTKLYLKLDVFQTYYFDIDFMKFTSLVDRGHLNRWDSNGNVIINNLMEDEGLEVGEYFVKNVINAYDFSTKGSFIVTSSTKLGASNGGQSGGSSSGDLYKNKLVSENGFVFIKSMEGFSSAPYNLGDGTRTIGYGTTEKYDKEHFDQLLPSCSERQASEVFADSLFTYSSYVYDTMKRYNVNMNNVKQNEFDAFVSFYYNHGNLTNKQIFIDYCNGVDKQTIYDKWLTTVIMEGSQFEEGLRNRRKAEAEVFLNNNYKFKEIYDLSTGQKITDNEGKGYVPSQFIVQTPDISALRQTIIDNAKMLLGKPYIWGGNYPPLGSDIGTDCSGYCQWSYNQANVKISRTTYTQINEGKEISYDNLKAGDLVFMNFSSPNVPEHVVMFISKNSDGSLHCYEAKGKDYGILETDRRDIENYRYRNLLGD